MTVSSLAFSFEEYDRDSVSLFTHFLFKYLLFNSDIGYFELKIDGGGEEDFTFSFLLLIKGMRQRVEFKIPVRDPWGGNRQ